MQLPTAKEAARYTSTPSILHENLFPCHIFKCGQPVFWNFSHAMSGVCPEHDCPSQEICIQIEAHLYFSKPTEKSNTGKEDASAS